MGGSIGIVELLFIFALIVGTPIAIIVLLMKRRNNSETFTSPDTVSLRELQEATTQTLQESLAPLENKIDSLSTRIDAIEKQISE